MLGNTSDSSKRLVAFDQISMVFCLAMFTIVPNYVAVQLNFSVIFQFDLVQCGGVSLQSLESTEGVTDANLYLLHLVSFAMVRYSR